MSNNDDKKVFELLEKAVYKAKKTLEKTQSFQPFFIIYTEKYGAKIYENEVKNTTESYALLEKNLIEQIKLHDVDIMILVSDVKIPNKFVETSPYGIRLHLEEKGQKKNKIAARFIYVPYQLCKTSKGEIFVELQTPVPIGFPAEYIV